MPNGDKPGRRLVIIQRVLQPDCLSQLAEFLVANPGAADGIKGALDNARKTVTLLEGLAGGDG